MFLNNSGLLKLLHRTLNIEIGIAIGYKDNIIIGNNRIRKNELNKYVPTQWAMEKRAKHFQKRMNKS